MQNDQAMLPSYLINRDYRNIIKSHDNVARLCSNESPLGTNPNVINAIKHSLTESHLYPDPECHELVTLISETLQIDTESILFGNGSTELIELASRCTLENSGNGIISEYAYPLYEILVKRYQGVVKIIPTIHWEYDLDSFRRSIDADTKIIYIANPNNPTGSWISHNQLIEFMNDVPNRTLVIIDEAYCDFMEGMPGYASSVSLIHTYANVLVTRTFSKAYGLAGLRIGYALGHPHIIQAMKMQKQSANVNRIAQYAALAAYQDDRYRETVIHEVEKNRIFLESRLKAMDIPFLKTHTNFMLVKVNQASIMAYKKLLTHGIIIQPMELYQLQNYIRISIGGEGDIIKLLTHLPNIFEDSHDR